jgi:hypothetical protein
LDFLGIDYVIDADSVFIASGMDVDDVAGGTRKPRRRRSKIYSASKVLLRVRRGYMTAMGGSFIAAEAAIQGVKAGKGFVPIRVPDGPTAGEELWRDNYKKALRYDLRESRHLYVKVQRSFMADRPLSKNELKRDNPAVVGKLRLYTVGDSLVCGVGSDNFEGPTMPPKMARCLSLVYKTDVTWYTHIHTNGILRLTDWFAQAIVWYQRWHRGADTQLDSQGV